MDPVKLLELSLNFVVLPYFVWATGAIVKMREDLQRNRVEMRELIDAFRKELYERKDN